MKSFLSGSVAALAALLAVSLGFDNQPLAATALLAQTSSLQEQETKTAPAIAAEQQAKTETSTADSHAAKSETAAPLTAPQVYVATAYARKGRGASGMGVRSGTIAADPKVLPFGTRVRLDAGQYSGEYIVTDAGTAIKGRKIDVWLPTYREACRFGRRNVKLVVLSYGGKRKTRQK